MAIVAVYSAATGRLRRIVRDTQIDAGRLAAIHVAAGEAAIEVPARTPPLASIVQPLVDQATGKTPSHDRYALVRDGIVAGAIYADPAIDRPKGAELIAHATAGKGWRMLADRTLAPPVAQLDEQIAVLTEARANLRIAKADPPPEERIKADETRLDSEIAALEALKART